MPVAHYSLGPPYSSFQPVNAADPHTINSAARGMLVVIRPTHDTRDGEALESIERLQLALSRFTLILWLDLVGIDRGASVAAAAGRRGVRGFVTRAVPDPVRLRAQLTERNDLPGDFVLWLERRGFTVRRSTRAMIVTAMQGAKDCRNLTELAARSSGRVDVWRDNLLRSGISSAQDFHQILRLLAIAVHIQREPSTPLSRMAEHYSYFDDSALRRRLGQVLGCPPSDLRKYLGWEWIADTALRRAGLTPPKSEAPRHGRRRAGEE
jgi:hypothetical protein